MLTLDNINLSILAIILFLAIFRFLKKAFHLVFLLAPPIFFSICSNYSFLTTFAFWFIFSDFMFNHFNKVANFFKAILLPKNAFSCSLFGKLNNCIIRVVSIYLIFKTYLFLFHSIISTDISIILTNSVISFINISIINIISNSLLKLHFIRTKKGSAI